QRLIQLQRRQDAGQAPSEHRLARTGWPAHEDVVPAGRGNLERAPRLLLAMDLAQVMLGRAPAVRDWCGGRLGWNRLAFEHVREDSREVCSGDHLEALD